MTDYQIEKQHAKGKLHAFERIHMVLDEGSFIEIGAGITHQSIDLEKELIDTPYDGVITGFGKINGKNVCIYSQDFTIVGGTLGKQHGKKIAETIKLAIKSKCPVIGIIDSGGARIQEGVNSLAGYGEVFFYNTRASGYIPQISIVAGPCAGGAVYSPGITDFIFVIDEISNMFVTGPKIVKSVTREEVTAEELGGVKVHVTQSGVAHFRSTSEAQCYKDVRRLITILPSCYDKQNKTETLGYINKIQKNIMSILPDKSNRSYDMMGIINEIIDDDSMMEIQSEFAKNIIIGLAKLSKITIGIVANQPNYLAGVLDCDASDKASRFIRYCDCFNIPIITLTDVPGFMPGVVQETRGIIRHGAKLLYAYSEATTIKINVIIRKAYGGAYIAMCSKHLDADFVYAWPTAEVAVMGAEGAIDVIYRKDIEKCSAAQKDKYRQKKIEEYNQKYCTPKIAIEAGYIDELISPENTRKVLFDSLTMLYNKEENIKILKKHGNIPL